MQSGRARDVTGGEIRVGERMNVGSGKTWVLDCFS